MTTLRLTTPDGPGVTIHCEPGDSVLVVNGKQYAIARHQVEFLHEATAETLGEPQWWPEARVELVGPTAVAAQ